jgi:hypothetical protein
MNEQNGWPAGCPPWCVLDHGINLGEEDHVHVSSPLCVRDTFIRLCSSVDPQTGLQDGPYVLLGHHEYALHEVEQLVTALTSLIEEARTSRARIPRPRSSS